MPGPGMFVVSLSGLVSPLREQVLQKNLQVAGRAPGIEFPVLRAQELAAPDAVEPGCLHGIDPVFERDSPAARPDVAPALLDVSPLPERIERIAEIDAKDELPIHSRDLFGSRTAVPQVI